MRLPPRRSVFSTAPVGAPCAGPGSGSERVLLCSLQLPQEALPSRPKVLCPAGGTSAAVRSGAASAPSSCRRASVPGSGLFRAGKRRALTVVAGGRSPPHPRRERVCSPGTAVRSLSRVAPRAQAPSSRFPAVVRLPPLLARAKSSRTSLCSELLTPSLPVGACE